MTGVLDALSGLGPAQAAVALGVLGLLIGSFLNVVVHRLPRMLERRWWGDAAAQFADTAGHQRTFSAPAAPALRQAAEQVDKQLEALPPLGLARPASRCPSCGHLIRWYENVPVISWLMLRGRCSACGASIGARYPAVEMGTALLFAATGWQHGATGTALMWAAVVAVLLAAALIDWDTTLLPDDLTLPLLWAGLLAAAAGWTLPLSQSVVGAAVGYLSLWSVYWLFKLATGKEGMGYGDFKLLGALGAWLGWQAILPIVLMASIIGAVVGLALKAGGGLREGRYVPFGPFLAGGGLVVMVVGTGPLLALIGQR